MTPVVGVVLMISVTVLLATVVGAVTLGYTDGMMQDVPQASLSVHASTAADEITIQHTGGDALQSEATRIVVEIDGTPATFAEISPGPALRVGTTAVVYTGADDKVDWDGDGTNETYQPTGGADVLPAIDGGDSVTLKLIDAGSQTVYFETTVTA